VIRAVFVERKHLPQSDFKNGSELLNGLVTRIALAELAVQSRPRNKGWFIWRNPV
jgi:hypothetical protein